MLLYLKLPSPSEDPDRLDPLRRPLNPLGNRQEISQALAYIRTHFQPDPEVSLPKKEVYNEYVSFCSSQSMKPLSTADFGKAMKQVYPVVRPRRLGERGNSRYCYSGLCNRNELEKPRTPATALARDAVSRKICIWASKILNIEVNNLTQLSTMVSSELTGDDTGEKLHIEVPSVIGGKKRKIKSEIAQSEKSRTCKQSKTNDQLIKGLRTNCLKPLVGTSSAQSLIGKAEAVAIAGPSNICDNINQKQIDVELLKMKPLAINNLDLKPEKSTNLGRKKSTDNNKRSSVKRSQRGKKKSVEASSTGKNNTISMKENKCTFYIENVFTIASIEDDPIIEPQTDLEGSSNLSGDFSKSDVALGEKKNLGFHSNNIKVLTDTCKKYKCDQSDDYNDLGYLTSTTESLAHYLQDEGNSQEPEEELLKYFKDPIKSVSSSYNMKDTCQLRLVLGQNVQEDTDLMCDGQLSERDTGFCEQNSIEIKEDDISLKNHLTSSPQESPLKSFIPTLHSSAAKRRVSFENIPDSFPQSPSTCIKNFSFTPISPRPATVSKSTVNINPFVFPRETVFRGKLSTANNGNHQNHNPSPVSRVHVSPHKGSFRSTSLSSTPSPIASGRSSSSAIMKGRCTPQDLIVEHSDSFKSSPLISPSSSSGVFLSPASPISSCNSPVFVFRKNMSPVKQGDDSKSYAKSNSLLQTLLLTGKCPETKYSNVQKGIEPLAVDVQFQTSNEQTPFAFRSHSVPALTTDIHVSPSSNTLPFPDSMFKDKETPAFLEIKPNDIDVLDTVLRSNKDNLVIENLSDNDTLESSIHTVGNDVSMESVFSNLCDFLNDKSLPGANDNMKASRSQPTTPLDYSESSNSSRDPVVSAFAISSVSKSYPSTPNTGSTHSFNGVTANLNSSVKKNINPMLDNLSMPVSSLSDDIDLQLNNFADLSACDDAFNQLAKEVTSSNSDKEV
ncbi:uncharacterized protein LOC128997843 isoform X2 [Macrosteles quadrilineatus]|nr:uncharacterized protein LOC128997843 isoform X2 [Macrosteles quadrilineatus]